MNEIRGVGVVGAGPMGAAVAEACALAGRDVLVIERDPGALATGRKRLLASLDRATRTGRLSRSERERAAWRLRWSTDTRELSDRRLVVEAVTEDAGAKSAVLADVSAVVGTDAIIASTTASLSITALASSLPRPSAVVGLHFLPPLHALPLVEIVTGLATDHRAADRVEVFVARVLGRRTLRSPDRAGYVINTLLVPYLLSAVRMVEADVATAAEVDAGMRAGCSHTRGPLETVDLIGLDAVLAVAESMYAEYREPQFVPPALLRRMVEAGMHGLRTGRGFHSYPSTAYPIPYEEIA